MPESDNKITVYYDGACPRCRRDRENYERLDPNADDEVEWFDITGRDERLKALGIDPRKALTELHIRTADGRILSELDAYRVLMARIPRYRWLGWFIGLPVVRPLARYLYHWSVTRRLQREGRL
ncbi:thiol-disulfide oxidoreductase DCC family protein [Marinobacterium sp. YM272]|uniref:thiol-disulfide oxidoreductase DCC family protein n=1 Tax=Marinobacterium sp. YM272 TaxID=3421654 RepID=UPI003D7F1A1B